MKPSSHADDEPGLELARAMTLQRPEMPVFLHTGNGENIASDVMMRSAETNR